MSDEKNRKRQKLWKRRIIIVTWIIQGITNKGGNSEVTEMRMDMIPYIKIRIYKTIVESITTYEAEVWKITERSRADCYRWNWITADAAVG